jgi:dipeptidyl aminopeptidase/acylaminoacyl peptidase
MKTMPQPLPQLIPKLPGDIPAALCRMSPDLARLAFYCSAVDPPGLFGGDVRDGDRPGALATRVASFEERQTLTELQWSPDGQFLAFTLSQGPPPGEVGVRLLRLKDQRVTAHAGIAFAFAGREATLLVADPAGSRVYLRDPHLEIEHTVCALADDGDPHFPPAIAASPDGRRFALVTRRVEDEVTQVHLVHHDGRQWRASYLTDVPSAWARVLPFWSPDSASCALYILDTEHRRTSIVAIPDRAGDGEILYRSDDGLDGAFTPAVHPDGRFIAIVRRDKRIALVDPVERALAPITDDDTIVGNLRFLDGETLLVEGGPGVWTIKLRLT